MELTQQLPELHLTDHGYRRGGQRNIYPSWLHISTAELFCVEKINQTVDKQIREYGSLMKILLPDIKFYVRDHQAIVTMVRRKRKSK